MSAARKTTKAKEPKAGAAGEGRTLTVRLVKSGICTPKDQKATIRGLGLRRIGQQVVRADDPAVRGMILKVRHLVEVVKD